MSKAIEEKLAEIYESLTEDEKREVEACKSMEELVEFAERAGIELTEEMRAYLLESDGEGASELSLDDLESAAGGRLPLQPMVRKWVEIYRKITGKRPYESEA